MVKSIVKNILTAEVSIRIVAIMSVALIAGTIGYILQTREDTNQITK
jgi:hypothetical protein